MKKLFLLLVMFVVLVACEKNEIEDVQTQNDLKDYYIADLMAGQNTFVGTVTFLDTEDGYFKITYELVDSWTMSESHAYAGPEGDLPRAKKKGNPKIGHFPYTSDHDPEVTTFTYTHVFDPWPNPDYLNDFVCAAHAVVNHPTLPSETAWASGADHVPFGTNGGWSSYVVFSTVSQVDNVVYGIQQNTDGSIGLVYINTISPVPEIILTEIVNTNGGEVVAAAFDPNENLLFFVIGNTLYVNNMNLDGPSVVIGTLPGIPSGGAFINGSFYYLNLDQDPNSSSSNEIVQVQLIYDDVNGTWTMNINENFSSPLPYTNYSITDMASNGTDIYLVGNDNNNNGQVGLINFTIGTNGSGTWSSNVTDTQLNGISQITFGPDGNLYAVDTDNTGNSELVSLDPGSGDKDIIDLPPGTDLGDLSDLVLGR